MAGDKVTAMVQGRLVYVIGDLFAGTVAKQFGTQTPKLNKNGLQYAEYGFGLAVPKSLFTPEKMGQGGPAEIWTKMHDVAYTLFPSRQIPPNFKMKWVDGDTGITQEGRPLNLKSGYPGHIVFNMKTTIPPKFFRNENGQNFQINEGIKCGDYVYVQVSIDCHSGTNAGLYLNPLAVQFLGYGEPIMNAPSGDQIFGTQAPQMPPGASAQPIAPQGQIMPQAPLLGQPGNSWTPPGQAPAPASFGGQQQAPVQPNWGVVPQQFQPGMPAQAPAPGMPGMPPFPGQNR